MPVGTKAEGCHFSRFWKMLQGFLKLIISPNKDVVIALISK